MYGVLPGGVFDGAPLTPPSGVVKSTWGNHQLGIGTSLRVGGASEGRRYVEMWFLSGWARAQCDP